MTASLKIFQWKRSTNLAYLKIIKFLKISHGEEDKTNFCLVIFELIVGSDESIWAQSYSHLFFANLETETKQILSSLTRISDNNVFIIFSSIVDFYVYSKK